MGAAPKTEPETWELVMAKQYLHSRDAKILTPPTGQGQDLGLLKIVMGGLGFENFQWYRRWVGGTWDGWCICTTRGKHTHAWFRHFPGTNYGILPDFTEHWPILPKAKARTS